jgi:hypothetical protein
MIPVPVIYSMHIVEKIKIKIPPLQKKKKLPVRVLHIFGTRPKTSDRTRPHRNWQVRHGLCSAFGSWKKVKLSHFINTIAQLNKYAELSSRLLQVKNDGWQKKGLFRNWPLIQNFFIAYLSILVRCKTKGAVGAVCALLRIWPSTGTVWDGAESLKSSHRMGDGRIFLINLRDTFFNEDLSNESNFGLIYFAGVPLSTVSINHVCTQSFF